MTTCGVLSRLDPAHHMATQHGGVMNPLSVSLYHLQYLQFTMCSYIHTFYIVFSVAVVSCHCIVSHCVSSCRSQCLCGLWQNYHCVLFVSKIRTLIWGQRGFRMSSWSIDLVSLSVFQQAGQTLPHNKICCSSHQDWAVWNPSWYREQVTCCSAHCCIIETDTDQHGLRLLADSCWR